jgi:hypothetical protein
MLLLPSRQLLLRQGLEKLGAYGDNATQRHPSVPAVLIGWLGRHSGNAGQGLGLAVRCHQTVTTAPIGAHAIFADAIDDKAAAFHASFGFTPLIKRPRTLYLPVATALSQLSR